MARPHIIKDEVILEAARQVFLEKGFRATTAEVARRAGVAEGSLFRRFPTKLALFQAAMKPRLEDPDWLRTLAFHVGTTDLRESLFEVGLQAIEFFRTLLPLMMMSWSNPSPKTGMPEYLSQEDPPPQRALRRLTHFFTTAIFTGQMRGVNASIVARMYMAGLHNYAAFETLFAVEGQNPVPAPHYVRCLVNLLWEGIAPPTRKPRKPRKPRPKEMKKPRRGARHPVNE